MSANPLSSAQKLGFVTSAAVVLLSLAYFVALAVGLLTLPSPDYPIQDPWFTAMEVLIIAMCPALVALVAALCAWVPVTRLPFGLVSLAFMTATAAITSAVHFSILTLGPTLMSTQPEWSRMLFAFEWPSLAYSLDILAWDVLFPIAVLFAAAAIPSNDSSRVVRRLLILSGVLAFVALAGVPLANLQVRNIGIIGYAVVFPVAAAFLMQLFRRSAIENAA